MLCELYSIEIILYYYFMGFSVPLCYSFALPVSFIYFLQNATELLYLRVYLSKQLHLTIHRNPKHLLKMKVIIFSSMLPCLLLTFCSGEKLSTILVIIYIYMYIKFRQLHLINRSQICPFLSIPVASIIFYTMTSQPKYYNLLLNFLHKILKEIFLNRDTYHFPAANCSLPISHSYIEINYARHRSKLFKYHNSLVLMTTVWHTYYFLFLFSFF